MTLEEMQQMEINETFELKPRRLRVRRVPGGFIYEYHGEDSADRPVFVPLEENPKFEFRDFGAGKKIA